MECSLCLDKISGCHKYKFKCKHIFHENCIKKWSGSCPNCRASRKVLTALDNPPLQSVSLYLHDPRILYCFNLFHYQTCYVSIDAPNICNIKCSTCNTITKIPKFIEF